MGLALARIGNALNTPGARIAKGVAIGAPVTTGTILAAQYANGSDFSKPSGIPNPLGWAAAGIAAGGATAITGAVQAGEYSRPGGITAVGIGAGIVASTFLVTPVLRRVMADNAGGA